MAKPFTPKDFGFLINVGTKEVPKWEFVKELPAGTTKGYYDVIDVLEPKIQVVVGDAEPKAGRYERYCADGRQAYHNGVFAPLKGMAVVMGLPVYIIEEGRTTFANYLEKMDGAYLLIVGAEKKVVIVASIAEVAPYVAMGVSRAWKLKGKVISERTNNQRSIQPGETVFSMKRMEAAVVDDPTTRPLVEHQCYVVEPEELKFRLSLG